MCQHIIQDDLILTAPKSGWEWISENFHSNNSCFNWKKDECLWREQQKPTSKKRIFWKWGGKIRIFLLYHLVVGNVVLMMIVRTSFCQPMLCELFKSILFVRPKHRCSSSNNPLSSVAFVSFSNAQSNQHSGDKLSLNTFHLLLDSSQTIISELQFFFWWNASTLQVTTMTA